MEYVEDTVLGCNFPRKVDRLYTPSDNIDYYDRTPLLVDTDIYLEDNRILGSDADVTLKYTMMRRYSYKCDFCGTIQWGEYPMRLEVDHIDGNHDNRRIDNFRLVCPNCHKQLDTSTAHKNEKQSGNKRKADDIVIFCKMCGTPLLHYRGQTDQLCMKCKHRKSVELNGFIKLERISDSEYPLDINKMRTKFTKSLARFNARELRHILDRASSMEELLRLIGYSDENRSSD